MTIRRMVAYTLACLLMAARSYAADAGQLSAMLGEAERIRSSDKPRSRQLLAAVERDPLAQSDAVLLARTQLLECRLADTFDQLFPAFEKGLAAAKRAKKPGLEAKLRNCHAGALLSESREGEAEREYLSALTLARQAGEVDTEAEALAGVGYGQYLHGAMADALGNLQTAYRLFSQLGNEKGRLDALTNIAHVYADPHVAQYDRAIEYYRELLGEYEKHGAPSDVADTFYNIGRTLETTGDFNGAELNYRRALAMFQRLDKPGDVAYTNRSLAMALMKQGHPAEALPMLDAALAVFDRAGDEGNTIMTRQYRGMVYRRLGRSPEALRELDTARRFYEKEKNLRFLEKNAEERAVVYAQLGDWRNAYEASSRHIALQLELATTRRDELSSRLRVEFDAEKKDRENRALARENALRATALREAERSRKLQIVVSALTALLAIALAILFWRQVVNTRRMRTMALTDELTRLPNRRHILTLVDIAFDAAKRESRPVAVIVLDIDRFKRINDTHGHAVGDAVLQGVARACRLALRGGDQIGRIGGEEFLVVLNSATAPEAGDVAERLRSAVERLDFSSLAPDLRVTISLGAWVDTRYDPTAAIAAADDLLYRAKEGGRNRVELGRLPLGKIEN